MGNGISLSYRTKNNSNPRGKPKVYLSYHPEDRIYLKHIVGLLHEKQDCAVYFYDYEKYGEPNTEDLGAMLGEMQLMVIPVTSKFLNQPNISFSYEFEWAKKNRENISFLPLLQDSSLTDEFNKKCGNLQYLDEYSKDETAVSFNEKLEKFLSDALISPDTTKRIQEAFKAYIFLSYRKKDRDHAKKLMKLIHEDPRCRDIAIWYDEFLVPGESFDDAIMDALTKSKLFTLLVTPSLLENRSDGKQNYVISDEYPEALRQNKHILAVESVPTDRKRLVREFSNIPHCIDAEDNQAVTEAVLGKLNITSENENTPEHLYLIGLAYLGGIDVEKNTDIAVSLITDAAKSGYYEAIKKLADMYFNGIGVIKNSEKAIMLQREYVSLLESDWHKLFDNEPKENLDLSISDVLIKERDILAFYMMTSEAEQAETAFMKNISLAMQLSELHPYQYLDYLATSYKNMRVLYAIHGREAESEQFFLKATEIWEKLACEKPESYFGKLAECYTDTGRFYQKEGQMLKAEGSYLKAITIYEKLAAENPELYNEPIAICYNNVGDLYRDEGYLGKAEGLYLRSIDIYKLLANEDSYLYAGRLAKNYNNMGKFYSAQCQTSKAEIFYLRATTVYENLEAEDPEQYIGDLVENYRNLCDFYENESQPKMADEFYTKAISILENHAIENPGRYGDALARIYDSAGVFYYKQGKAAQSEKLLLNAVAIQEKLIEKDPDRNDHDLFVSYNNIMVFYSKQGQIEKAEEHFLRFIGIYERLAAENPERYNDALAVGYNNIGVFYQKHGLAEKAKEFYLKSIMLCEKLAEKDHDRYNEDLVINYNDAGEVYDMLGITEKAKECFLRAIVILEELSASNPDKYNDDLADSYKNIGNVYIKQGQDEKAEEYFEKARALQES